MKREFDNSLFYCLLNYEKKNYINFENKIVSGAVCKDTLNFLKGNI